MAGVWLQQFAFQHLLGVVHQQYIVVLSKQMCHNAESLGTKERQKIKELSVASESTGESAQVEWHVQT